MVNNVISDLVKMIENVDAGGGESYTYAVNATRALVIAESDVGFNLLLTKIKSIENYSRKDQWSPESEASVFHDLANIYQQNWEAGNDRNWGDVMAAFYRMAEKRRLEGRKVISENPILNLQSLLDGTFNPKNRAKTNSKTVIESELKEELETKPETTEAKTPDSSAITTGQSVIKNPVVKPESDSNNTFLYIILGVLGIVALVALVRKKK